MIQTLFIILILFSSSSKTNNSYELIMLNQCLLEDYYILKFKQCSNNKSFTIVTAKERPKLIENYDTLKIGDFYELCIVKSDSVIYARMCDTCCFIHHDNDSISIKNDDTSVVYSNIAREGLHEIIQINGSKQNNFIFHAQRTGDVFIRGLNIEDAFEWNNDTLRGNIYFDEAIIGKHIKSNRILNECP